MDVGAVSAARLTGGTAPGPETVSGRAPQPDRTREACRAFETYFTASLLEAMVKTTGAAGKTGVGGQEASWAWSQMSQAVAEEMSRGDGLGLARQLEAVLRGK